MYIFYTQLFCEFRAYSPHVRNLGNFCLWNQESWALLSVIQLKESRFLLTIRIRNPSSIDSANGIQCLEFGINNVKFSIQDCLGLPSLGKACCQSAATFLPIPLNDASRRCIAWPYAGFEIPPYGARYM